MKKFIIIFLFLIVPIFVYFILYKFKLPFLSSKISNQVQETKKEISKNIEEKVVEETKQLNPLSIEYMRNQQYPGSDIVFEQTLPAGSNYKKYVVSYKSEGNNIFALLTIPTTQMPQGGYPVVIFNHGYIPPKEYRTTEKYVAYQDAFARAGYVTIKSDYRGHGSSGGIASGGYGTPGYVTDVLNSVTSIKNLQNPNTKQKIVDSEKIGMWGHSMGGYITLRALVAKQNIKAGVIWAGVVASYPDLINNWRRPGITPDVPRNTLPTISIWRAKLIQEFGEPSEDSPFWKSISANFYLSDISGPVQIHHGTADSSVPVEFSQKLDKQLQEANKTVEYYEYIGDDHNLSKNLYTALNRSVEFFDRYLK